MITSWCVLKNKSQETKEKISELAVSETGIKLIPANTVIMSFKLTIGKTAITSEPLYTNEAIAAFIPKSEKINNDYLRYALSLKDWTAEAKKAVKGATLNKESIENSQVFIPNKEEQDNFAVFVQQSDKSKHLLEICPFF